MTWTLALLTSPFMTEKSGFPLTNLGRIAVKRYALLGLLLLASRAGRGSSQEPLPIEKKDLVEDAIRTFVTCCNLGENEAALAMFTDLSGLAEGTSPSRIVKNLASPKHPYNRPLITVIQVSPVTSDGKGIRGTFYFKQFWSHEARNELSWRERNRFCEVDYWLVREQDRFAFASFVVRPSARAAAIERRMRIAKYDNMLSSTVPPRRRAQLLASKAGYLLRLGECEAAERTVSGALVLGRTVQQVHTILAGALKAQGKYAEAIKQYTEAMAFEKGLLRREDALREIRKCEELLARHGDGNGAAREGP